MTALLAALACGITWVVLVSPGGAGRAAPPAGTTVRASVHDDGTEAQYGGGDSQVSGNGRFDVFTSYTSLGTGPGNGTHPDPGNCGCNDLNSAIFVRDLATGQTSQVSIGFQAADGPNSPMRVEQPDDNSFSPSISANGRYISFITYANNIVPSDIRTRGNPTSIIVCDRGAPDGKGGIAATRGLDALYPSYFQCVRVAAFTQPVPGQAPHLDGAGDEIVWVQPNAALGTYHTIGYVGALSSTNGQLNTPTAGNDTPFPTTVLGQDPPSEPVQAEISPDGQWVVFGAVPVFANHNAGFAKPEAVAEFKYGSAVDAQRVDVDSSGGIVGDFQTVGDADVSNGGTTVVFDASNDGNLTSYPDVYAVTVDANAVASGADNGDNDVTSSVVVSRVPDKTAAGSGGDGAYPTVSADGRYVAFVTDRDGMFNTPGVVFTGNSGFSSCLSVDDTTSGNPAPTQSPSPSTPDGSSSSDSSPVSPRINRKHPAAAPPSGGFQGSGYGDRTPCQVAVRDLVADHQRAVRGEPFVFAHLASPSRNNECEPGAGQQCNGDGDSENPVSLSDNGAQVGFDSAADDLVPDDTNASTDGPTNDAFVRTWTPSLKAGTLTFGNVAVGASSDQSLTLTVDGFGPIPLGPVTVGGTNGGDFTVVSSTCAGATLHEPDSCVITIEFTPSAPGPRSGTVSVQPPATPLVPDPDPIITVPVNGNGSTTPTTPPPTTTPPPPHGKPNFAADPDSVNFGSDIPLHKPGLTRTVTITNSGTAKLVLTNISIVAGSIPGAKRDFTVSIPPCASHIQPGGSCIITITFIGHAVGPRNAVLRIADNTGGAPHVIPLGGRIRPPTITVNPAVSPTGRVVTVTGVGFAPRRVVQIGFLLSGEQASVKADRKGNFSIGLVVFPNSDEGPRTITSQTVKVDQSISAQTPLLVVLGTLESPTLVIRH